MGKGRDKELIRLRDEALCRRYYHWTEVERLRFDDALKVLSEREFFISEERILAIIRRKLREGTDRVFTIPGRVRCPRLSAGTACSEVVPRGLQPREQQVRARETR